MSTPLDQEWRRLFDSRPDGFQIDQEFLGRIIGAVVRAERLACAEICVDIGTSPTLRNGAGPEWKRIRDRILARPALPE